MSSLLNLLSACSVHLSAANFSAEYWLHKKCAYPDNQPFDWGLMWIRYPFSMYGIGDILSTDADDVHRKKRFTEVCGSLYLDETMIPMLVLSDCRGCHDSKRKKKIR